MGKHIIDDVANAGLAVIAAGDVLTICSQEPTTRTEAVTTFKLADVVLTPGDGNGDYTIADGDTQGREVTIAAQTAVPVDTAGTANHLAICDATRLILVTPLEVSEVLAGDSTVNTEAFSHTINDVTP